MHSLFRSWEVLTLVDRQCTYDNSTIHDFVKFRNTWSCVAVRGRVRSCMVVRGRAWSFVLVRGRSTNTENNA